MPFLKDEFWPTGLLTIFEHAQSKNTGFENRYYGPYDKLLNYCFGGPESFTFYVAPQSPPRDDSRDSVDFVVFIVVYDLNDKPVFLAEVKDDAWAQKAELRYRADKQMRDRYALMLDDCPVPRLWGVSLFGTKMRVYCGDTDSYAVRPERIERPNSAHVLKPEFLAGEWDLDVLSKEGFAKMKELVADVLTHVQGLNTNM